MHASKVFISEPAVDAWFIPGSKCKRGAKPVLAKVCSSGRRQNPSVRLGAARSARYAAVFLSIRFMCRSKRASTSDGCAIKPVIHAVSGLCFAGSIDISPAPAPSVLLTLTLSPVCCIAGPDFS